MISLTSKESYKLGKTVGVIIRDPHRNLYLELCRAVAERKLVLLRAKAKGNKCGSD